MRRLFIVLFATFLMVGGGEDLFAKGSRGGSSFRSSPSKSSFKSSKPKSVKPKPTVKPKKTRTDQKSTMKKTTSTQKKPKAISSNKMNKKQTKAMKAKNTAAGKKYGNKANASKAFKADMAKKHTSYRSATPPAQRPASIPQTVVINNGPPISVGYHPFGGGFYGYGYMDPVTGMYVRLTAAQMIANDMAMQSSGYGHYGADGMPVVYRNTGAYILWICIGLFILIIFLAVLIKVLDN